MSKLPLIAAAFALGALGAQAARADVVANFDPRTQKSASYSVDDAAATSESIIITIVGFSFIPSVLGTYGMNEEPPFSTFGSDQITVSNTGPNGWGVIDVLSADLPRFATTCNDVPDESVSPFCILDLPLANSGGADLGVTFFSPAGDIPGSSLSDTLDITVPEPASWAMLGFGVAGLGLLARRRRKVV